MAVDLEPSDSDDWGVKTHLDRAIRALGHPLRRQILRMLADSSASASVISKEIGVDIGVVSYHLSQVLAKECDVVKLVKMVPRRGALEKIYGLEFEITSGVGASGSEGEAPRGPRRMSLEECLIAAVVASDGKGAGQLGGSAWEWSLASVDAAAWEEIAEARDEFNQRVDAAVEKSRGRGGEDPRKVVVGAAAFPAASTPAAP
ncbi:MAG TPA: winged helix-turn-helix domain-containing protein [Solirubrobacterales bacterium]|nr:winged helix-turn-helix domain-containing protein [Solirubrobacterales bacterium]